MKTVHVFEILGKAKKAWDCFLFFSRFVYKVSFKCHLQSMSSISDECARKAKKKKKKKIEKTNA